MSAPPACAIRSWQADFYQRWFSSPALLLEEPWPALAWLLFAPDLLDAAAPAWQGRLARWPSQAPAPATLPAWRQALLSHSAPQLLQQAWDALQTSLPQQTRLGRQAEKLLGFYLAASGQLQAQGVQVRSQLPQGGWRTVGEFDFLLYASADTLLHWELATKFYLYAPLQNGAAAPDYFLGPNLADSLGAKMRKILQRQLGLGQLGAAQLALPLQAAQAYVKGWLFYPWRVADVEDFSGRQELTALCQSTGLSPAHCRGWWCRLSDWAMLDASLGAPHWRLLPRLRWLAPAWLAPQHADQARPCHAWAGELAQQFAQQAMPQLMAAMQPGADGVWRECARVFVAPDDWLLRARAGERGAG
ncbi:DUF1853 family protein [Massilia sp. W12]|uniref:DUF1853 family protein n=1 Tax=Massilia sp. W12 TaxID=3126507 RepID=UPI0030D1FB62